MTSLITMTTSLTPQDQQYSFKLCGLINTGAICWFNALLQSLMSLNVLTRTMIANTQAYINDNNLFAIAYLKMYSDALNSTSININPNSLNVLKSFVHRLRQFKPTALLTGQQDAEEGYTLFLEMLLNSSNFAYNEFVSEEKALADPVFLLFNNRYVMKIQCPNCNKTVSEKRNYSCKIEMFNDINFTTEKEFTEYIYNHTSEVDKYTCEECNVTSKKLQRNEVLRMLKEIICIQFNKFTIHSNRWYPATLTFEGANGSSLQYQLVATIEHSGNQFGGHYWARCKRGNEYYLFNDTQLAKINDLRPTPNTYTIFYQQVPMLLLENKS